MESLGFSDATSVWVERPSLIQARPDHDPGDPLAAWRPEMEKGFEASNIRLGLMVFLGVMLGCLSFLGYWLYQRPQLQETAALSELHARATALAAGMDDVVAYSASLTGQETEVAASDLAVVETAARALFEASAQLPSDQVEERSLATTAAGVTLDAIDLARDTIAYRVAVGPVLVPPSLETNPELIELGQAAREFGDWQLRFDQVRTALPDGALSSVTERMDTLSGELAAMLTAYVDALRADDLAGAEAIVAQLSAELTELTELLDEESDFAQESVEAKVVEARGALAALGG